MNRVAFSIGSIEIYWYSIMILIGIIFATFVLLPEVKKQKINKDNFENMIFYTIIVGLVGARIYYVLFNLDYYLSNPLEIFAVWNGGLAIHGGVIAGVAFIYFYTKKKKMPFIKILDICMPALLIGQVMGRWGNFFNQEAHGGIVKLEFLNKLHLPDFIINGMYIDGNYYHPTFLYESMLNFVCFVIMIILRRNKKVKEGNFVSMYLIWYGIIRFFIEGLRTDSLMLGSIRVAQLVSILMVIGGIVLLFISRKRELYNKEIVK